MKFSLITTVFNEEESIKKFIKSLNEQTEYPDEFIIVDGGSSDKTIEILSNELTSKIPFNIIMDKSCNKKYSNGPIAKGRNIAIENANYENILVTDAGCILDQDWIKEMKKSFIENNADVVSGWYKANITNEFQKNIADIFFVLVLIKLIKKSSYLLLDR